jgi:hypothetical protein
MTSLPPPTPCGASRADEREPRRVVSPTSDGRPDRPNCHAGAHKMREQYLEDFAVGQIFGSGRLRMRPSGSRVSPPSSIRNRSISTRTARAVRFSKGWPRAAGAPRRERDQARRRHCRRRLRRVPLAAAGPPRGRVSAGERSAGRAAVEVAAGTGMDQGPDDHAGPERRRRAGPDREPGGAAPAGLGAESPRHVVRGEFHDTDSGR